MTILEAVLSCALVGLLLIAAFLALAEVALLRVDKAMLVTEDLSDPGIRRIRALLDELPLVLNTVLLMVILVQVGSAAVSGYLAERWFGGAAVTVSAIVLTGVLFVYAEVIPKTIALRSPVGSAQLMAGPVTGLVRVFRPITRALAAIADLHLPSADLSARTTLTEQALRALVIESARAGEIEADDADLVERSFDFGDRRVRDVLVGPADVVAVDESTSISDALARAIEHGHRRLPVCAGGLDHVVGVVRLRDLAAAAGSATPVNLVALSAPPLRVAPDDLVSTVLRGMQDSGRRFAVVADSRGGTAGILTIEDIVAELVGEIEDQE